MIKYDKVMLTFLEVPDEISMCINCTCCPLRCRGCFEPWLQEDCGKELTFEELDKLTAQCPGITCVCFMGGINDYNTLYHLMAHLKYRGYKIAIYSGHDYFQPGIVDLADYYKIGPYIPERGPLNNPNTNQKFFKKENNEWIDITYRFQLKRV